MAPIPIGIFSQGITGKYWVIGESYSGFTASSSSGDGAVAASGNIYISRNWSNSSTLLYTHALSKYAADGTLIWRKAIATGTSTEIVHKVFVDSSENVYELIANGSTSDHKIRKWDSNGNVLFYKTILTGVNGIARMYVTSAGLIHIAAELGGSDVNKVTLLTINSSGALVMQKKYAGTYATPNFNTIVNNIYVEPITGDIYISAQGDFDTANTKSPVVILKISSTGTLSWAKKFNFSSYDAYAGAPFTPVSPMYVDNTASKLYIGLPLATGADQLHIAQIDTSTAATGWLKKSSVTGRAETIIPVSSTEIGVTTESSNYVRLTSAGSLVTSRQAYRRIANVSSDAVLHVANGSNTTLGILPNSAGYDGTWSIGSGTYVLGNVSATISDATGWSNTTITSSITTSTPTLSLTSLTNQTTSTPSITIQKVDIA